MTANLRAGVSSRIVKAPSTGFSALGGSKLAPKVQCDHMAPHFVAPWTGEPGSVGTVAVVGAGKMGLTLVAQFASHHWRVIAIDIDPNVVDSVNRGLSHIDEPGLSEILSTAHAEGRLSATLDAAAAHEADVLVLIVPIVLDKDGRPEYRAMDAAVQAILPGLKRGQTVIFETTLPVGDTRQRYAPRLAESNGLVLEDDLFVAFSPERLYSGAALANLSMYPKLVGGIGPASTERAARFYESVLDAEVVTMSSAEAAEMAKLAETTYRDVNIALANEFAAYASAMDVDIREIIAAANSQPYSHVHQPGVGVGGHCIPVYPRFLLSRGPALPLVALARSINDGQVEVAVSLLRGRLGDLGGEKALVLGLTYRHGVKELAYSLGPQLVRALRAEGADVYAYDPLLEPGEVEVLGATPWEWGAELTTAAIVTQTADPKWALLDLAWFPGLRILLDGRNSLVDFALPENSWQVGFGIPARTGS